MAAYPQQGNSEWWHHAGRVTQGQDQQLSAQNDPPSFYYGQQRPINSTDPALHVSSARQGAANEYNPRPEQRSVVPGYAHASDVQHAREGQGYYGPHDSSVADTLARLSNQRPNTESTRNTAPFPTYDSHAASAAGYRPMQSAAQSGQHLAGTRSGSPLSTTASMQHNGSYSQSSLERISYDQSRFAAAYARQGLAASGSVQQYVQQSADRARNDARYMAQSRPGVMFNTHASRMQDGSHDPDAMSSAPIRRPPSASSIDPEHRRSPSLQQMRDNSMTPNANSTSQRHVPQPAITRAPMSAPQNTTVDPTQVYDRYPEQQRLAQQIAEQRRKLKEAEAARQAQEKQAQEARQAEAAREAALQTEMARAETEAKARAAMSVVDIHAVRREQREGLAAARKLAQAGRSGHSASPTTASTVDVAQGKDTVASQEPVKKKRGRPSKKQPPLSALTVVDSTEETSSAPAATPDTLNMTVPPTAPPQVAAAADTRPDKKRQLAETIFAWLTGQPANADVDITTDELFNLLNKYTAYSDFCSVLDRKGCWLNRAALAKIILEAEPNLRGSAAAKATPAPSSVVPQHMLGPIAGTIKDPTQAAGMPSEEAPVAPIEHDDYVPPLSVDDPIDDPAYIRANLPPRSDAHAPDRSFSITQTPPRVHPVGHEMGAMSHAQAEAMQNLRHASVNSRLSQGPSTHRIMTKAEAARQRTSGLLAEIGSMTVDSDDDEFTSAPNQFTDQNTASVLGFPTPEHSSNKTDMGINNTTSLATPSAQAPPVQIPPAVQAADLRGEILVEAIKKENVARRSHYDIRTIARDVLLASGRHAQMRPINDHLRTLAPLLASHSTDVEHYRYDLGTIRWDLIDPRPAGYRLPEADMMDDDMDADDESVGGNLISHDNADGTISIVRQLGPELTAKSRMLKRGRGRPPASLVSKIIKSRAAGADVLPQDLVAMRGIRTDGTAGQEAVDGDGHAPQMGYGAFGPRKSGRPKGSGTRQAVDGNVPSAKKTKTHQNGDHDDAGMGRTSNVPTPMNFEPEYNVYPCKWSGCGAQLHNMHSLRKHVIKVHGRRNTEFNCQWDTCPDNGGKSKHKVSSSGRLAFPGLVAWHEHMENAHFKPLARLLGDGPRGGLSGNHHGSIDCGGH